ncbi:long-chain-fatty-acid--CoA ligase [Rhodoferax ferrireducens]|uniref:long-chain-fatty-acid--CoA ligase n=1 Tax=Rhodoferax ferrireducens TaxID=192843 RepID=UPI000E0DEB63|nr:long-chain-fatty-acid--CoA ligase [Rhodoferax ferrireducens]
MWLHADITSLPDIVRHHARTTPDKTALIEGGHRMTFRELDQSSNRLAQAVTRLGAGPDSVVAFIGKNSIPFFEILFGVNKAGGTMLPLNWRLVPAELIPIVDDAQPALVFVDKEFMPLMEAVLKGVAKPFKVVALDSTAVGDSGLAAWCSDAPNVDPGLPEDPRSIALLMYTSGTTGKAKGVEMSHQGISYMRLCESLEPVYQWHDDDVLLMVMPNFHLLGASLPVQSLYHGSTVSILHTLEPGKLLSAIAHDRPSILVLAPTVIQMVLDHPAAKSTDFSSVRLTMYAGSPINAQLLKRAMIEMKGKFMQFYGATESLGAITILRPDQHDLNHEEKLKSCGTPLPLIELRIDDGTGHALPDGEIGEFVIRSPAMFTSYRNQPEATAAVLQRGWYRTGDAGFRDKDGLLYIVDRVKDMIVSGGENVYSAEVEQAIQKHPAVAMSAVIGAPDQRWGEKVVAVIVLKTGCTATAEEISQHCRGLIAGYKVPKEIRFADSLPISPTGKILKRLLRQAS